MLEDRFPDFSPQVGEFFLLEAHNIVSLLDRAPVPTLGESRDCSRLAPDMAPAATVAILFSYTD